MINIENITQLRRKTLGLTIVLTASAIAFAQEKQQISGKIVDTQMNAVPYASVIFKNKTVKENATLFSDATLTDDKGNFNLNLISGTYEITIEAIDFKKTTITKQITVGTNNLGDLKLEQEATTTYTKTKDIENVTLTATTKPYKIELDKRTYDVNQDIISKGGNLQDVLANVPSISVDTDGTVSMRGSSNIKFLINGKPSALLGIDDGANALQSIPADQIDRIEVITNPSSKFEASGTAGILNIILKKNKKVGFNGSVIGTLGYIPHTSLNTNLSWRKGNLIWFVNGGGGYRENKGTSKSKAIFYNPKIGSLSESSSLSITNSKNNNYNASTGLVYDLSEKTSVNISGTMRTFESKNDGNIDYSYLYNSAPDSFRNRKNIGKNNNLALQSDFGIDHKFNDKGNNLSLSLSFQRNKSENNTDIDETENNNFVLQNIIKQETTNKSIIGKVDYELPINENSKLETGYRLDINNNDYDNSVQEKTVSNPILSNLGLYSYTALYKESFNAFYAQFKSKIGKLGYQIGLRDELSKIEINYINLNGKIINKEKNYNNIFPSVFLSYDLGKDNQILVNYSKRIDRPRAYFMIPNPTYNDNQNIFDGNIDLDPSYVDSYELGYSTTKKKFTINPTLYIRHQTNDIKMLLYNQKETIEGQDVIVFHMKPINLGSDDRYGLDLNFNFDATSWLKLLGNIDLFGYNTKGSINYNTLDPNGKPIIATANFNGSGFAARARLTSTFKIDKTFNFQIQGYYRGGQKTEFENRKDLYSINIGANKTVLNGNGTISFNIQDIFNTRAMERTNFTENSSRYMYMQWLPRQFSLSFTYRFKQGDKVDQPKKKKDVNNNVQGGDDTPPM